MEGQEITLRFIQAVFVVCIAFDYWVIQRYGKEASISWVGFRWACDNPIVPLTVGIIIGHIFWNR